MILYQITYLNCDLIGMMDYKIENIYKTILNIIFKSKNIVITSSFVVTRYSKRQVTQYINIIM